MKLNGKRTKRKMVYTKWKIYFISKDWVYGTQTLITNSKSINKRTQEKERQSEIKNIFQHILEQYSIAKALKCTLYANKEIYFVVVVAII